MKLKFRIWRLKAPKGSPMQEYSVLPIALLMSEGAFMSRSTLINVLKQVEEGGKRIDHQWDFIYVQRPGFTSRVMDPNFDRWESFGPGWGKFERVDKAIPQFAVDAYMKDSQDWVMLLSLDTHVGVEPITVTLKDWIDAKSYYAWQDMIQKKRYAAEDKVRLKK